LRRPAFLLLLLPFLSTVPSFHRAHAADGFRLYEGTAATVNKEVLFLSDVLREQCLLRCGAGPGGVAEALSLEEARDRLISDTLAMQEHEKLALGQVDNAVLAERVREALARAAGCDSPCGRGVSAAEIGGWVERKLLVGDFLRRRVGAFLEVKDEDVKKELQRRSAEGAAAPGTAEETVRRDLLEEKIAKEVRNWRARAASKATITLSPLEGK
jgi:hypothetical protein